MFKAISLALALLGSTSVFAAGAAPWSYHGETAPEHWSELSPEYATCKAQNQTPINIRNAAKTNLAPLYMAYSSDAQKITNTGHTVQISYAEGSTIEVDGEKFTLKQMHFHTPSENQIQGKSYPMELHLVHANADGALAVVGVMFVEGKDNTDLAKLWRAMPKKAGESVNLLSENTVSAYSFLPKKQEYYRFSGSLTTPPCSEGVRWLVMKTPIDASAAQIKAFTDTMGTHTNRPIQALNGRVILE